MQPEGNMPDENNEPMISGDVQSGQFVQQGMQPGTIMIDPNTGLPQNIIIMQQPSAAPKVVGILVIIWGSIFTILSAIGVIGLSLYTDSDSDLYVKQVADSPTILYLITGVSIFAFIGQIVGGSFMVQKKKMGIFITWACLVVLFIGDIATELVYPDLTASQAGDLGTGLNLGFSAVCSGICGLLVAIPLMVSGNGMDGQNQIL
ncbi:MAG: hypothetical protein HN874_00195 [Euryarchaeota archaeon]|jgi:hypothetical protein|nr:hypothetical protein [Euryarchaeota archaeon]